MTRCNFGRVTRSAYVEALADHYLDDEDEDVAAIEFSGLE